MSEKEIKAKIGISHGDINGIGYEIILKTFADSRMLEMCTPILYGSAKIATYYKKAMAVSDFIFNPIKSAEQAGNKKFNIISINNEEIKIEPGKSTSIAGELAFASLEAAITDVQKGLLDALVTAPINKKNIQSPSFDFPGHTEYLQKRLNTDDSLMIMVCNKLRIGILTSHLALQDVPKAITVDFLLKKIKTMSHSLQRDFAIHRPKIAVLALNPHAGDGGVIGKEDMNVVEPAIKKAQEQGLLVHGPYPADGFFGSQEYAKFDGVLAMYHDQGLIPFKLLSFKEGVNFTAGLPIVRTSPSHGTAYELAGKDKASSESFRQAVYLACDILNNRKMYDEITKDPLKISQPRNEKDEDI